MNAVSTALQIKLYFFFYCFVICFKQHNFNLAIIDLIAPISDNNYTSALFVLIALHRCIDVHNEAAYAKWNVLEWWSLIIVRYKR